MAEVNLPYNIKNGDGLDADQVMANDQTLAQSINGGLEAGSNVTTAAAVTQTGANSLEGTASTLARSDHTHLIQGVENATADPTVGNFEGRVYWNSTNNVFRYYDGTTWFDLTPSAASLIIHAAQHKDGGHDPLADTTVTDHMRAVHTLTTATLGADTGTLSTASWTTILDLTVPASVLLQTYAVDLVLRIQNTDSAGKCRAALRVIDNTAGGTPTIWRMPSIQLSAQNGSNDAVPITATFRYNVPVAGTRVLRLQGATLQDAAHGSVIAQKAITDNGDAFATPTLVGVVV